MEKTKRTRVRALEGRMIEKLTIYGNDDSEGDQEFIGASLEIRASGGYVFMFHAAPIPSATTQIGRLDSKGDMYLEDRRRWK